MSHNNIVLIAAVEAEDAAKMAGGDLENRLRAAMKAAANHWMATDEGDQFTAAMEGCARTCDPDELERMQAEIRRLQRISALLSGMPLDWEQIKAEQDAETAEPVCAQKLWREVKDRASG